MDFEKQRQNAQNQLDSKLAEVDRLSGVAKELEKKTAEAQVKHDELVETLSSDIDSLRAEKAFAEEEIEKVKADLKEKQDEVNDIKREIKVLSEDQETIIGLIEEKKRELAVVEQTGEKTIKAIEVKVAEKQAEVKDAEFKYADVITRGVQELDALKAPTRKAEKELNEVVTKVEEKTAELVNLKRDIKDTVALAEQADHQAIVAKQEVDRAGYQLRTVTEEFEITKTKLDSLKAEIETVQTELKPLLAKRIDSINYMKELEYKEANLRKKYEDVGLEYN